MAKSWKHSFIGENKEDLISLACSYYKSEEGRKLFKVPLLINSGEKTWKITRGTIETFPQCNHEEADTRLILHAAMSKSPAVIVAKDTDVFLLLAYAVCYQNNPPRWYMKIDASQFINIIMIHNSVGRDVCSILQELLSITGSDTAAYKFQHRKSKSIEKSDQRSVKYASN